MDALSLILEAFDPIAGRRILDVGCGSGGLARALVGHGAIVTGVDPNDDVLALAGRSVPQATFLTGSATSLPFPDAGYDGAVFLNSLHHVPDPRAGLREAARVVRPGSRIVVVEPLARGSSFDVLRPIDDETAIRAVAQEAIADAVREGELRCDRDVTFERLELFDDVDQFLARATAVNPGRSAAIGENRPVISAIFDRVSEPDGTGKRLLRQPLRAHILSPAS